MLARTGQPRRCHRLPAYRQPSTCRPCLSSTVSSTLEEVFCVALVGQAIEVCAHSDFEFLMSEYEARSTASHLVVIYGIGVA